MAVSNEVKRIVVLVLSGALLFISVASIVNSYQDIVSLIINVLVIVGSVGGLVGAWRMDVRHLGWFFWTLAMLICIETAFILFHFLHHDDAYTAWHWTSYSLVTLAVLVLGIICTYDLRRSLGVDSLHGEAPLLGTGAVV